MKSRRSSLPQTDQPAGGVNGKQIHLIIADEPVTIPEPWRPSRGRWSGKGAGPDQFIISAPRCWPPLTISRVMEFHPWIGGTNFTLTRRGNPWLSGRVGDSIAALAMIKYIDEDGGLKAAQDRHPS